MSARPDPGGFVCLYYGGTGSSWLLNTIETSPFLLIPAYEPLEWMHWPASDEAKLAWIDAALDVPDSADPDAVAAWKLRLRTSPQFVEFDPKPFRVVGFKMSPEAVGDIDGLLDVLSKRGGKLLAIGRDDRVRHALSLYRAHEEDKHQFQGAGLLPPTKLKKRVFLKWLEHSVQVAADMENIVARAVQALPPGDVLRIVYEDFVSDEGKVRTVERVAHFLGVPSAGMRQSGYRKATPDDLEAAVANYDAMRRWLEKRGISLPNGTDT